MRTLVGLIFSPSGGHVVELAVHGRRVRGHRDWLLSWATPDERQEALAHVVSQVASGARWVVGIPGDRVTHRRVSLPVRGREPPLKTLAYGLEEHVPDDSEALCAAWIGLTEAELAEGLALALPASELQAVLQALAQAGIDPEQVVPADLACWLGYGNALGSAWVLDASGSPPALLAFLEGLPVGRHVFNPGRLDCSELRWACLALERHTGAAPARLFVAGEAGTPDDVVRDLPVPPEPIPALPGGLDYRPAAALAAAGLNSGPVRRLTLRCGDLAYRGTWARHRRSAVAVLALVLVCGAAGIAQLAARYWQLSSEVKTVRAQTLAVFREVLPTSKPVNMPVQLEQHLNQLRIQTKGGQAMPPQLMRGLASVFAAAPQEARLLLEELRFDPPRVVLEGSVASRASFDRWRQNLEATGKYQAVTAGARQAAGAGGRYGFALTLQLRAERST
jgi:type II secretion system protein L